ncbi:MAG: hypothetical protein R3E91_03975 [Chlamydiales bacterium]
MGTSVYTEDDLKKILKTLFAEKKRVKELQKQLGEKGLQKKFQNKLVDIHHLAMSEEYTVLRSAYTAKDHECHDLRNKLEKVRPALKKLVDTLQETRLEMESLKEQREHSWDQIFKERFEKVQEHVSLLEKERENFLFEKEKLEKDKQKLEEEKTHLLEEEKNNLAYRERFLKLEEDMDSQKLLFSNLQKEKEMAEIALDEAKSILVEKERELERAWVSEQKDTTRFETERSRLVERLAEGLSQIKDQTEIIKDLRDENANLQSRYQDRVEKLKYCEEQIIQLKEKEKSLIEISKENGELKGDLSKLEEEFERKQQEFSSQVSDWSAREKQIEEMEKELIKTRIQLEESDLNVVREEYEAKLVISQKEYEKTLDDLKAKYEETKDKVTTLNEELHHTLEDKEKLLEKSYVKMRELSARHADMIEEIGTVSKRLEEKKHDLTCLEKEYDLTKSALHKAKLDCENYNAEIHKAQQHLGKKVKESTILQDLSERQKHQIAELQKVLNKQENELGRLQNSLDLQQMHEQKLQSMANERTQAAESLAKDWQEKYLVLQQELQEKINRLSELQKMQENYDQMVETVSSLKQILGKRGE